MLTTAPHLQIRRPSPTTAEFTVTTALPPSLAQRALLLLTIPLRLSLALAVLLLLHGAVFPQPPPSPPPLLSDCFSSPACLAWALRGSLPGRLLSRLAAALPPAALVAVAAAALWAAVARVHASESLLVLRGLGVQTATAGGTYLSAPRTRFIPTAQIRDVLINEAFRGMEVRYYLVVVVEGEEDVVVVFPRLLPRLDVVERVWRGVRGCLFEGEGARGLGKG